jgi:hypothetical protein
MKKVFIPWLIDVPFVLMSLIVFCTWRSPFLVRRLWIETGDDDQDSLPNPNSATVLANDDKKDAEIAQNRRLTALTYFALVFADIISVTGGKQKEGREKMMLFFHVTPS